MKDIRAFMIAAVPSLDTQLQVVGRLAEIDQARQLLEVAQRTKINSLDELKKSLLHQAFTGRLSEKSADKEISEVA